MKSLTQIKRMNGIHRSVAIIVAIYHWAYHRELQLVDHRRQCTMAVGLRQLS